MIGDQMAGSCARRSSLNRSPAPGALTAMPEPFRRLFCPTCRKFLLEIYHEGHVALQIKCRQCTRTARREIIVVIELAAPPPPIVHSPPEPTERDSTPP